MSDGLDWMDQALSSGLPAKFVALAPTESVAAGLVEPPAPTVSAPAQVIEPGQPRPGEYVQSKRVVKPAPADQPQEIAVEVSTEIATEPNYAPHPESYFPRVFTFVRNDQTYYEQLKTGEAIPRKASPEGRGFDFWITDTDYIANLGVYRIATGRRS